MIPTLDHRGLLPAGIHSATWDEVADIFATNVHRVTLISGARNFSRNELSVLFPAPLFLAGSTFSDKVRPADIEATIKVDPKNLTVDQTMKVFELQASHSRIKTSHNIDFYVTLAMEIEHFKAMDYTVFFQYVGEKSASAKGLSSKDMRGIIEVEEWHHP